ncbi:hypothetical protein LCGC14_1200410 [marine sediment metagenome]|uniref:Uncharacterized protein n=1 Tax=marine sediment metagenome TaxID=412755 RepID=A0A0F9PLU2_9ZZZZ
MIAVAREKIPLDTSPRALRVFRGCFLKVLRKNTYHFLSRVSKTTPPIPAIPADHLG